MKHWPIVVAAIILSQAAAAQGVSTAGVRGRVVTEGGPVSARIEVRNESTGAVTLLRTRDGRFLIEGLEPGGPYSIIASAIGFSPARHQRIILRIGETRELTIELRSAGTTLDTVRVSARTREGAIELGGGSGMIIDSTMITRLPTLNRDLYDFARLVPQISTKITLSNPGLSAAGTGFRFNNFLINGVTDRTLSGNVSNAFSGLRSIPLDAVREYQVLISPYDIRYGDFAGALVNAVTRSGTNKRQGSAFIYARNDDLARTNSYPAGYERIQYGLTAGGPVLKDRVHYFAAAELQRLTYPGSGPYMGQPAGAERPVPVTASQIEQFTALMNSHGLVAGSGGRVENSSPLRNFFGQLNFSLPRWYSRAALWVNLTRSNDVLFSRASRDTFSLTSTLSSRQSSGRAVAFRLNSAFEKIGASNELLVSHRSDALDPGPRVEQPIIRVSVPSTSGSRIILNSGTQEVAQSTWFRASQSSVEDVMSIQSGSGHVAVLGGKVERFRLRRGGLGGSYGIWNFSSIEDFALGIADRYDVRLDFGSSTAPVRGSQYSLFAGDQWTLGESVMLTGGVRADMLALDGRAPYQRRVDSLFDRRTDMQPSPRIELSPRLGMSWRLNRSQMLRGGMGLFTSRYPLAWIQNALSSYGVGGTLTCSRLGGGLGAPPAFVPDHLSPPTSCASGATITPDFQGEVDLVNPHLHLMRVARGSLAHEIRLARGTTLLSEAMLSRNLSDFVFMNLNLSEPVATDLQGRVIYAPIRTSGVVTPNPRPTFVEVIDLRNTSQNRSYQLSTRLEKVNRNGSGGSASYTFSRVRDVQTPVRVNTTGRVAWASARVVSGRHDVLTRGISGNDIPHRVVLQGIYAHDWAAGRTDFSFYYVGESGRPFTYVAFGTLPGRGDLNGDRAVGNDPIYVPRNARDTTEIRFSGISDSTGADNSSSAQAIRIARQASALETLIDKTSCMKSQRGKILVRNSCREPWSNTTIASVRHALPVLDHSLEVQADVFNVLNLVNRRWGSRREAIPSLLEHVGQTEGTPDIARPIFRLPASALRWTTLPVESSFQLQLAVRYRF